MKTVFSVSLFLVLFTLSAGSSIREETIIYRCFNQSYSYMVETDLSVSEFYESFCERLKNKYNWHKISEVFNSDKAYIVVFTFNEINNSRWICELKIEKAKNLLNTISVEMLFKPYSGS